LVAPDNAASTSLNPSALATLESWSLTYSHIAPASTTRYRDRYDAVWLATPLLDGFTVGTGLDFQRARDGSRADANGFVLGGALHPSSLWSVGTTWRMRSPQARVDNIHVADVALSVRPSPTIALSVIGRDLAPHNRRLGVTDASGRAREIRESGTLAIAVRPLGDDRFMLELAGRGDASGEFGVRSAAQVAVPWVGRLGVAGEFGELAGRDTWTLSAGLDVRLDQLSVAPAVHFDERASEVGWSLLADVHGAPRIGVPAPGYVAKVELRGLGPRGLISAMRTLDRALHDPRVRGVVLVPDGISAGLATAQELRLMIEALQRAGKPVYCYLQAASGSEYYACAAARRRAIDPAGMVRLMGVGGEALYFGELLRKLGLRADFVRIGRYKSAPEQYTNDGSSAETREVRMSLLDSAYGRLVHDLSSDLGQSEQNVKALIDRGPFLAEEALREHLVAAAIDKRELESDARAVYGRARFSQPEPPARDPRFGPTGQVGVVVIDGTIVDGENVDVPFIDIHMSGGRTVAESIDRLADDSRIRAIVLRIDSPGGAVMASDQIWRAVKRARAKKPVVASMGEVAASGGYYVAAGANEIWGSPSTITGSIGIFYGKVDVAQLAARVGVGVESAARGAHAGADSLFRPFTDEERAALTGKLRLWYRQFLERVAEGRNLPIERVDELARGRVYSGDEAQALGLIDSLGGFASALARARELAGLGPEARLVVVPRIPSTLLEYVFGAGASASAAVAVPSGLKPLLQQLYMWSRVSAFEPLALYEGPLRLE
jgi:protease-4